MSGAPLRVVYVSPHASRGGAERVTMDLLALHDREAVVPSVIFLKGGPLVAEAEALGVSTAVIEAPRLRRVGAARAVRRELARRFATLGADVVHGVMAWGHLYAGPAARRARVPAVWFQHGVPAWRQSLDVLAALTPAKRILVNSALTLHAQRRLNPRRVPLELVYPGVRLPLEPHAARRRRGRAALGLPDEAFLVGLVARLARGKGHPVLLHAARSLCNARADAHIVICGETLFGLDPDYPDELRRLVADLGLQNRATFVGAEVEVMDVLAALDVAVHVPTAPESFGLAVIEAMASGAAVVAGDSGAVREVVEPGLNALLVPAGDHEALAVALLMLHDDPAVQRSLAAAAETAVRERFDAVRTARRVEAIYREVARR